VAVLRDHTALLVGEVPDEVRPVIEREVEAKHAKEFWAGSAGEGALGYQMKNFLLAIFATDEVLEQADDTAVKRVQERFRSGELSIPGRLQWEPGDPPMIFDAAHNAEGARALAQALPSFGGAHVFCCIAILAEKDAREMLRVLAGVCEGFVCTQIPESAIEGSGRPSVESWEAQELARLCREAGSEAEAIADPLEAWERARELAHERDGVALAAGSHYLLSTIWTERPAQSY